jgi:hypothetical protein
MYWAKVKNELEITTLFTVLSAITVNLSLRSTWSPTKKERTSGNVGYVNLEVNPSTL